MVKRKCMYCKASYEVDQSAWRKGEGRCCSPVCAALHKSKRGAGGWAGQLRRARMADLETCASLARAVGYTRAAVSQVELGVNMPSDRFVAAVRAARPQWGL